MEADCESHDLFSQFSVCSVCVLFSYENTLTCHIHFLWGLVFNPLHVCRYTHVKGVRLKLGDNGYRRKLILCVCSSVNEARRMKMGFFALLSSPFLSPIIPHFIPFLPRALHSIPVFISLSAPHPSSSHPVLLLNPTSLPAPVIDRVSSPCNDH